MEKKSVVFLTVIAVATLLVAVVGATFAYFSTTVSSNVGTTDGKYNNTAEVTTAKFSSTTITFGMTGEGNRLVMTDVIPGTSKEATFTVKNDGSTDIDYNISWTDVTNNFGETVDGVVGHPEELVYSLSCTGGTSYTGTETTMPTTAGVIASNLKVTAGQTATCTITATFKETNDNQNYNQGRSFSGTINVNTENISGN